MFAPPVFTMIGSIAANLLSGAGEAALMLSGDASDGNDTLLLSGDASDGNDVLLLSEI